MIPGCPSGTSASPTTLNAGLQSFGNYMAPLMADKIMTHIAFGVCDSPIPTTTTLAPSTTVPPTTPIPTPTPVPPTTTVVPTTTMTPTTTADTTTTATPTSTAVPSTVVPTTTTAPTTTDAPTTTVTPTTTDEPTTTTIPTTTAPTTTVPTTTVSPTTDTPTTTTIPTTTVVPTTTAPNTTEAPTDTATSTTTIEPTTSETPTVASTTTTTEPTTTTAPTITTALPTTTTALTTTTDAPTTNAVPTTVAATPLVPQPLVLYFVGSIGEDLIAIGSGFATNAVQFRLTDLGNITKSTVINGTPPTQDFSLRVTPSFNFAGYLIEISKDNFASISGATIAKTDVPFMNDLRTSMQSTITSTPTMAPSTAIPITLTPAVGLSTAPIKEHRELDIVYIISTGNNILLTGSGFETNDIFIRLKNATHTLRLEPVAWSDSTAEAEVKGLLIGSKLEIANDTVFSNVATTMNVSSVPFIFYTKTRPATAVSLIPTVTTHLPSTVTPTQTMNPTSTPLSFATTTAPAKELFVVDYIASTGNNIVAIGSGFSTNDVFVRVKNATDTETMKATVWSDSAAEVFVDSPLVGHSIEISNQSNFETVAASLMVVTTVPFVHDTRANSTPIATPMPTSLPTAVPTTTATITITTLIPTTTFSATQSQLATTASPSRIDTTSLSTTSTPTKLKNSKPFVVHSITSTGDTILSIGAGFLTNSVYLRLTNATDTAVRQAVSLSDTSAEADLESTMTGFLVEISNETSFSWIAASAFINTTSPFVVAAHALSGWTARVPSCNGLLAYDPAVCSGVGTCTSENTCICGGLYSGSNCENYNCFGIPHTDPSVCNGIGRCIGLDNCSCDGTGKYGNNCLFPLCYGIKMEDTNVCNGHGFCTNTDTCKCYYGWASQLCNVPVCFNFTADDPNVCWGRGSCVSPDTCVCNSQYIGHKCKSPPMQIESILPFVVINGGSLNITGSGFVQTTGTISCQYWVTDGIEYGLVTATIVSETEVSCAVNIEAATNEVINVRLVRSGSPNDDADPSNAAVFSIVNSVLKSTDCGQVPGSTGCPNVTVTNGNFIIAAALEEGRRSLQSTAKSNILDMQGYVDFTINDLKGSHGSPIEFWFFGEVPLPSLYTALEVGNKLSLFFDNVGGGLYFDRVQEKCVFETNIKYRMILKIYKPDSMYIINSTLYTMPDAMALCTVEQVPRSFDPVLFFSQNYSLVLSASSNSEQKAIADVSDSSVQLAVDAMVIECQPQKCKVNNAPLVSILTAAQVPFPWIAIVLPAIIIIILIIIAFIVIIVCISIYMRKNDI